MVDLKYFVIGFSISLVGSIPLGLITITILRRSILAGRMAGFAVSAGASIAEFIYTVIALKLLLILMSTTEISLVIQLISSALFLFLGFFYFFRKHRPPTLEEPLPNRHTLDFLRGAAVGFMNVLIIPFWLVVGAVMRDRGLDFSSNRMLLIFSLAAALGATVVFLSYAALGQFIRPKLDRLVRYTDQAVGIIFFLLATYQIISATLV